MYANILVPTDGSPLSDKAVKHATMIAQAGGGKLLLFHVVAPYQMAVYAEGMQVPSLPRQAVLKNAARKAGRILARAEKRAKAAKVPVGRAWAISGSPRHAIAEIASKRRCDLIVMGSHGRSGLSRMFLGSETQGVLPRVKIPVLVVR
ncbi:MAG TPA: universal stress protein [Burkholderiales bacterium]|nr:universal stress protein [Burkholderiales bacterium]